MPSSQKRPAQQHAHRDYLQREFDSHPSLAASLSDFSPSLPIHSTAALRSAHDRSDSELDSASDSAGPWSPPAWRRPGSGWYEAQAQAQAQAQAHTQRRPSPVLERRGGLLGASGVAVSGLAARHASPVRQRRESPARIKTEAVVDEHDLLLPANVPLPGSPLKGSPEPSPEPEERRAGGVRQEFRQEKQAQAQAPVASHDKNNYIRFAVRAEVQQRTEPIEAAISWTRRQLDRVTRSKGSLLSFATTVLLAVLLVRGLLAPPEQSPGPDLVKVGALAKSFEPLLHYSEAGAQQIGDLQETGVAVWDLGESVRFSNMTSAPIIVRELDDLSESLKTLAMELTRFFANVDGDIDSILIVMEWAQRELAQLSTAPSTSTQTVYTNLHQLAHKLGGPPASSLLVTLFGPTSHALTRATLQRTFGEFLNVLEESINAELLASATLFALFAAIDRQFLNLQRTVLRETDTQQAAHEAADAELANLWRRALGTNAARVAKYARNRALLESVKERTVRNKLILVDHNGKLLQLKANLEILRRKIVSPLLSRANESSTMGVEEQIKGLEGTYEYLRRARERQKSRFVERLYGVGGGRRGSVVGEEYGIEGR